MVLDFDPPAFPEPTDRYWAESGESFALRGMTLRQYYAAKAMAAMISTAAAPCMLGLDGVEPHIAKNAFKMADAMIKSEGESLRTVP